MNISILFLHISIISTITLLTLRLGKEAMTAWLSLLAVTMNLFVLKQITLFGLDVTCSDALAVGYLLGLNLLQEFFGQTYAKKTVWTTFLLSFSFLILFLIHLAYKPNDHDWSHLHFLSLFLPMPRLLLASLTTFLIVQLFNIKFFGLLLKKWDKTPLPLRALVATALSLILDTTLFSILGLYGLVANLFHVILFSTLIKLVATSLFTPLLLVTNKIIPQENGHI